MHGTQNIKLQIFSLLLTRGKKDVLPFDRPFAEYCNQNFNSKKRFPRAHAVVQTREMRAQKEKSLS